MHRGIDVVTISFEKNDSILSCLKTLPCLTWSQTHKAWYIPYKENVSGIIFELLRDKIFVDYSALKKPGIIENAKQGTPFLKRNEITDAATKNLTPLNEKQEEKLKGFLHWMKSRRYSESTVGTYTDALRIFLRYFQKKEVEEITNEDLVRFNNEYILANKLSASYQNQVVNAVKLFFRTIQLRSMEVELIHRPKRAKLLPNVLSKEEIKNLLGAHQNIKHKTMLSLLYSCGLRRSELLNLKLNDIDSKRGLIIIRQAKGKKDRIVPLSEKMLILLRDYYVACKPSIWLFEGQIVKEKYDKGSLAKVLKQAVEKSKIDKPVTLHWLRHSYATHLLENGTDLRYIQEILGHSRSTTTEIYTHVSNQNIRKIISPFDSL